jgi:OmpA-OmpF porin, OOP family
MRSSIVIFALFIVAGCAETQRTCRPMMTWSSPGSVCAGASVPPPVVEPALTPAPPPPPARVQVTDNKIEITEIVQFETGKAILLPKSEDLLKEVAEEFKKHPEIVQVEVEGHTDSQGNTNLNVKLSESRAKAVRDFLINQGIEGSRLVPKGYGESKPVADNATEDGRYKNRRVEFKITKRN